MGKQDNEREGAQPEDRKTEGREPGTEGEP